MRGGAGGPLTDAACTSERLGDDGFGIDISPNLRHWGDGATFQSAEQNGGWHMSSKEIASTPIFDTDSNALSGLTWLYTTAERQELTLLPR
jgi:hypothetical protein